MFFKSCMLLIIASFFRFDYFKTVLFITVGWITHFASDSLFRSLLINPQAMLLFPFSWNMFSFSLLWSDEYYIILIIAMILYLTVKLSKLKLTKVI